jgi:hypothetical protein
MSVDTMRAYVRELHLRHTESTRKHPATVALREHRKGAELPPPNVTKALGEVFRNMGLDTRAARIAAAGRRGIYETVTKHEDPTGNFKGGDFPATDYAVVGDDQDPETWSLPLTLTPGGTPDPDHVRAAVLAIDPTSPQANPGITDAQMPAVIAKLTKAWKAALPDEELPAILTAEAAALLRLGVPIKGLSAAMRGRNRRSY